MCKRTYCRIRKTLESKSNMEEDKSAVLEAQLGQAKQIAEDSDKKYDEVRLWFHPWMLVV